MFKECNRILTIWDNENNEYVNAYEIQDKVMTVKFSLMAAIVIKKRRKKCAFLVVR